MSAGPHHTCTIVMYHYVRDLQNSQYPEIKGLDLALFHDQIAYLEKEYQFIRVEELIAAQSGNHVLPPNSVLLTFDDGYSDHFDNVFPYLHKKNIQGCFYIPATTVLENKMLDVNKIHFILAAVSNTSTLLTEVYSQLDAHRAAYSLESNAYYFSKLAVANRFDPKEIIFIKRLLQVELPEVARGKITDHLFRKFVSQDEADFSRNLYMSESQLKEMAQNGMHIGGHGNQHYWLASLSRAAQKIEIEASKAFSQNMGADMDQWTFCYPYGNYNQDTLELLQEANCKAAFTTQVRIADIQSDNMLTLPRLDTNDLLNK